MKQQGKSIDSLQAKKYLTIGELAEQLGISIEVLRKWERDFPKVIRPLRTKGDTRLYDHRQQQQVRMVYRLLRQEGMTIAGAQQRLRGRQSEEEQTQQVIQRLQEVRGQLVGLAEELDRLLPPEERLSSIAN